MRTIGSRTGLIQRVLGLSCLSLMLSACGSPQNFLDGIIESKGYIPYNLPMASAGVGTILKGAPSALNVVANPQTCFPDTLDDKATKLRWVSETDLPHLNKKFEMKFGLELSSLMVLGTPLASLNLGFRHAKNVELEFEGAAIEMLDQVRFFNHYFRVSESCRLFFDNYPFITQALRVNKMKFTFYTATGAKIQLSPGMIGQVVNIGVGVDWSIENNYTLNINTPKYIGYQVSKIGELDTNGGTIRWHAHQVTRNDEFKWNLVHGFDVRALSLTNNWMPAEPLPATPIGLNLF